MSIAPRYTVTYYFLMSPICSIGWGHQNTQPSVLVPTLMAQYKFLIEKLYASGGRKFLFLNVPRTDRKPSKHTLRG